MVASTTVLSDVTSNGAGPELRLTKRPRRVEWAIEVALFLAGLLSILTTVGIVLVLSGEAITFLLRPDVTLLEFLTGPVWQPAIGKFGVLPLLNATLLVTAIGLLVAVPVGLATAVYMSEYASPTTRDRLKPTLEVLAGVPTVVYGYFALTFVTPLLRSAIGQEVVQIYNVASAGIVVGILITPLVASMSEDAMHAVPRALREAAFGLGATRLETSLQVVIPAALSGLAAAFMIAMSRAIGETMVVAMAAGARPALSLNPFEAAETMTGYISRVSSGDLSYGTVDYQSIFAIGLLLFLITLVLNLVSIRVVRHFREVYQ